MFEQVFKNIDDILHKDAGCTSELDYTEQSSWLLFLKYLDSLERDKASVAALEGKKYTHILTPDFRWSTWAAPKDKAGKIDHNKALSGDDLRDFVNGKLFPYLHGFKQRATGPDTIEYKIGEIFGEIKNRIQSGYNLRDIIDHIDELKFGSQVEKHELSHLYEAKIKNMGNAGRNGGEYYTPRPLIRAMIRVLKPKIGETIYDGACGSTGFLCESFDFLKASAKLTTRDLDLPCIQVQRTARLRVSGRLSWRYLFHLLRSQEFVSYLLDGQTGLGVPHISGKQILAFQISRPSLADQIVIAENLDALLTETQRLASLYQQKLAALAALKKSLLHQAFSGEL